MEPPAERHIGATCDAEVVAAAASATDMFEMTPAGEYLLDIVAVGPLCAAH